MYKLKPCPLCGTEHEFKPWLNIICSCGAKYYFAEKFWLNRKLENGGQTMRLIDADACPALFDEQFKKTRRLILKGETHLDNLAEGFHEATRVLWRMPTIEAEPVKHGRWIVQHEGENNFVDCSERGTVGSPFWKRCPMCEVKMDVTDINVGNKTED